MDPVTLGLGVLSGAMDLIKEAKTASKEQHDAIVARLEKTNAELQDALTAARAARASESQATADAIAAVKGS